MKFYFGETEHPGCLRFFRGTIKAKGYADQHCYFEQPLEKLIGISFGRGWFLGLMFVGLSRDVRDLLPPADREGK